MSDDDRPGEHYVRHIQALAPVRQVEIVYELIERLTARHPNADMYAIWGIMDEWQRTCIAVIVNPSRSLSDAMSVGPDEVIAFMLGHPKPEKRLPPMPMAYDVFNSVNIGTTSKPRLIPVDEHVEALALVSRL